MKHLPLLACAWILTAVSAFGQTSGAILGQVTDPSGAAIANSKITVKNLENGFTNTATSDTDGR